jgi:hypothetical protein
MIFEKKCYTFGAWERGKTEKKAVWLLSKMYQMYAEDGTFLHELIGLIKAYSFALNVTSLTVTRN